MQKFRALRYVAMQCDAAGLAKRNQNTYGYYKRIGKVWQRTVHVKPAVAAAIM